MTDWPAISAAISSATRQPFQLINHEAAGGGCINQTYRIHGQDGRQYFVKLNDACYAAMFAAEVAGLEAIAAAQTICVPHPVAHGITNSHSFLVLEYLELRSDGDVRLLGEQLAALHRCTNEQFGFVQDNFIGTTVQPNGWKDNWLDFWGEQRLGFQLRLAAQNGYGGVLQTLGKKLLDVLPAFFANYSPPPSLLHGDLWSGNHAFLADGTPVIFDSAPYYGDRECDLAMTELFGGYPADFYVAYRGAYPLDAGYAVRKELYNLYHILNHANLFGAGYARQAESMMQKLLADRTG
ncbi:MAG TPA: fructosamine kinase family protein [Gallionella sp.]|jgi:fructosamine-3-kinase|nr:fructosamine kinase family protein [Gallionella sp.]